MARYYDVITPQLASCVAEWYQQAINEPEMARFMTSGNYVSFYAPESTTWDYTYLMDKARHGLVYLKPNYQPAGCIEVTLHVLPAANQRYIAGKLLYSAYQYAKHFMCGRYLEWVVHDSNASSIRISEHVCRKLKGERWGRKKEAMWDSKLAELVDSSHFRVPLR